MQVTSIVLSSDDMDDSPRYVRKPKDTILDISLVNSANPADPVLVEVAVKEPSMEPNKPEAMFYTIALEVENALKVKMMLVDSNGTTVDTKEVG